MRGAQGGIGASNGGRTADWRRGRRATMPKAVEGRARLFLGRPAGQPNRERAMGRRRSGSFTARRTIVGYRCVRKWPERAWPLRDESGLTRSDHHTSYGDR